LEEGSSATDSLDGFNGWEEEGGGKKEEGRGKREEGRIYQETRFLRLSAVGNEKSGKKPGFRELSASWKDYAGC
jgi:hypothetical protein